MVHNFKNSNSDIIERKFRIPIVSYVSAGAAMPAESHYPNFYEEYLKIPFNINDPDAFALRIIGDSMYPKYSDGDYVIASDNKIAENRVILR